MNVFQIHQNGIKNKYYILAQIFFDSSLSKISFFIFSEITSNKVYNY